MSRTSLQTDYSLSFTEWFEQANKEWPYAQAFERYGQYLYNRMPNRLLGKVPFAFDPFYDDSKIELFLEWLKRNWR